MADFNLEKMAKAVAEKVLQDFKNDGLFVSRWIPISERPPEESGRYLAYIVNEYDTNYRYIMTCEYITNASSGWIPDDECASDNVVAWMHLPEEPDKAGHKSIDFHDHETKSQEHKSYT